MVCLPTGSLSATNGVTHSGRVCPSISTCAPTGSLVIWRSPVVGLVLPLRAASLEAAASATGGGVGLEFASVTGGCAAGSVVGGCVASALVGGGTAGCPSCSACFATSMAFCACC